MQHSQQEQVEEQKEFQSLQKSISQYEEQHHQTQRNKEKRTYVANFKKRVAVKYLNKLFCFTPT